MPTPTSGSGCGMSISGPPPEAPEQMSLEDLNKMVAEGPEPEDIQAQVQEAAQAEGEAVDVVQLEH